MVRASIIPATKGGEEARPVEGLHLVEREDDALICAAHWQGFNKAIARRPALMSNEDWRPIANRIIASLSTKGIDTEVKP